MSDIRTKWLAFYTEHVEEISKGMFSHVEKMIIGTLIISAGAHVTSNEPAIELFGCLRHGLVCRGVALVGIVLLVLSCFVCPHALAKLDWHVVYQVAMSLCYIALSVRLIQLILAFRAE